MTTIKETLINKFTDHTARIGIIGVGYVGLPLAVVFAEAGFDVIGIDPIQEKV
ncbi:MAG: UDP-N-acetyl-D-glucosamine dehydrogenase, partial [Anaerolineales bacterium]